MGGIENKLGEKNLIASTVHLGTISIMQTLESYAKKYQESAHGGWRANLGAMPELRDVRRDRYGQDAQRWREGCRPSWNDDEEANK